MINFDFYIFISKKVKLFGIRNSRNVSNFRKFIFVFIIGVIWILMRDKRNWLVLYSNYDIFLL